MKLKTLGGLVVLAISQPALSNIDIQFDYTYDTNSFFSDQARKDVLEAASAVFESRFTDQLLAINSSGANSYDTFVFNPSDPFTSASYIKLDSISVAENVILVFAGGYNFTDNTLGVGGTGYSCSGVGSFCSDSARRGQGDVTGMDAIDVAPWGGSISFDSAGTNWHFGTTATGLDASEYDFYSVVVHELAHLLGFGASDSYDNHVIGTNFVGTNAGTVALEAGDSGHWANGTMSTVNGIAQEAAMDPSIFNGQRKYFTDLDFAAMADIGWQVAPVPEADTWAMMIAGLGLIGFAARRRTRI